jgi:hypothetical protein
MLAGRYVAFKYVLMKLVIKVLLLFLLTSCHETIKPRHYKSLDEFTGGFNTFELFLKENGELELIVNTSKSAESDQSGEIWSVSTKTFQGKWIYKSGRIAYDIFTNKSSIDSVFENSDFSELKQSELLSFSKNMDTAYIYGVPCIIEKMN